MTPHALRKNLHALLLDGMSYRVYTTDPLHRFNTKSARGSFYHTHRPQSCARRPGLPEPLPSPNDPAYAYYRHMIVVRVASPRRTLRWHDNTLAGLYRGIAAQVANLMMPQP